ncbi:MAG TPA: sulfatase [Polyangiaceae bacterium]|nr:sulfatase [Polyangiaceae bacterium]
MELDRRLLLTLPFLAFGCSEPAASAPAQPQQVAEATPAESAPTKEAQAAPAKEASAAVKAKRTFGNRPLNVILLTVDALRADMPWTGYARDIAPNLTKLAARSIVFENHRATTSNTAQSLPTLLTGRFASSLYRSGYFFAGYAEDNEMFPEILQSKGVRTIGVQAHMYFNRGKGLEQGFDVWDMVPGISFNEKTDEHVTSAKTTQALTDLLSKPENTSARFFAWTHYMDPHHEYVKHKDSPDFGNSLRDVYDNEVHHTDHHIGQFLAFAEKQSWWKDTAVIVTADHGEAFGEHGRNQHAHDLYEEVVRVPLMFYAPGVEGRRVTSLHTHLDLAPTIVELMNAGTLTGAQGQSLVPVLNGDTLPAKPVVLELAADNVQPARQAIVVENYKLIRFGSKAGAPEKLFDLQADPKESRDLSRDQPEKATELSKALDARFEAVPSVQPFGGMKLKDGSVANGPKKRSVASL